MDTLKGSHSLSHKCGGFYADFCFEAYPNMSKTMFCLQLGPFPGKMEAKNYWSKLMLKIIGQS